MEPPLNPENQQATITSELENLLERAIPDPVSAGIRFANYIVDQIAVYVLMFLWDHLFPEDPLANVFISLGIWFGYYTIAEGFFARTLGKLCTDTKVIKSDGTLFTFTDALLRSLCRLIPFEPLSAFGRPWHDSITKTRVVKRTQG